MRVRGGVALATPIALIAAAVAVAAGASTLTLTGPHRNVMGQNFNFTIRGVAAGAADHVVAWEQFHKRGGCAPTYLAESARAPLAAYSLTLWTDRAVTPNAPYLLVARFGAAHLGTHGICAYLINQQTKVTYAQAGAWWVNVNAGGAGGTSGGGATLEPAPLGSGSCQAQRLPDGSVYAQIAISHASCNQVAAVAGGADRARGAAYSAAGFSCRGTAEGPGSTWASAWGGTYYAYSCRNGAAQIAFNWGTRYTY